MLKILLLVICVKATFSSEFLTANANDLLSFLDESVVVPSHSLDLVCRSVRANGTMCGFLNNTVAGLASHCRHEHCKNNCFSLCINTNQCAFRNFIISTTKPIRRHHAMKFKFDGICPNQTLWIDHLTGFFHTIIEATN